MMGVSGKLMGSGNRYPSLIFAQSNVSAVGNTVAIGAHQADQLIIVWAFNAASTTIPTTPAGLGYSVLTSPVNTSLSIAGKVAYKVATSSSEVTGTWTNATDVAVIVYGGIDPLNPVTGAFASNRLVTPAATTDASYRTVAMDDIRGNSWVVGLIGSTATAAGLNIGSAPHGMVNRTFARDASTACAGHDSNGNRFPLNVWPTTSVTLNQTVKPLTVVFEIVSA
jgi:hypothetical protein